MKTKTLIIIITTLIIVGVTAGAYYYVTFLTSEDEYYLTYYPTHEEGGRETRVLLLDSDLRYGVYDRDIHQLRGCKRAVRKGDPCIIINVTIRNDYEEEWPAGYQIALTAYTYNTEGEKVGTVMNYGQRFCGFVEAWKVECDETRTFDIYIDYDNQDIGRYELYIYNIQKYPTP